jgi:hypothetical protein
MEYRPNTSTAKLQNTGHAKGRSHMRGRVKEGRYKGEYGCCTLEIRMNRTFKPVEITIRRGLR